MLPAPGSLQAARGSQHPGVRNSQEPRGEHVTPAQPPQRRELPAQAPTHGVWLGAPLPARVPGGLSLPDGGTRQSGPPRTRLL